MSVTQDFQRNTLCETSRESAIETFRPKKKSAIRDHVMWSYIKKGPGAFRDTYFLSSRMLLRPTENTWIRASRSGAREQLEQDRSARPGGDHEEGSFNPFSGPETA